MTRYPLNRIFRAVSCLIMCIAATGCCIREDRSDCRVTVRVEAAVPDDEPAIVDVVIYIFGSRGEFLERRVSELGRVESLVFPNAGRLTIVSWCNTLDGSVDVAPLSAGSTIGDGVLSLLRMPANANIPGTFYLPPGDLFFGSVTANNNQQTENVILPVSRQVASMTIRVRSLTQFTGIFDSGYSLVVGTTKNKVDFTGRFFGDNVSYLPASAFDTQQDLVAPIFNLFPSSEEEPFTVKIYHNADLIYEAAVNNNGAPLRAVVNQTLNVLIDFTTSDINVSVDMTGWGVVRNWEKVFN